MIQFDDTIGLNQLFRLMFLGTIISFILIFGYNFYQKKHYPQVTFYEQIHGKVTKLSTYQSVINIELDSEKRFMILESRNHAYVPSSIQNLITRGDSVCKNKDSDTIRIIKGKKIYIFLLGKSIN